MVDDKPDQEIPEPTELGLPSSRVGDRIGNYRLIQKVGEGGMGEVYQAEQEKPLRRVVALKVIKPGMDSRQVIARFESERQALALMDHRSIAQVFDAGTTEKGRPYFVMEYAKGIPIDEYCDKNQLKTSERLDLFVQVCEGVHHAHQKGIIHRDIKASNVLVVIQDKKPIPKIIDFGIAKATGSRLTEGTAFTEVGQLIGTPEYMSPEQAEMSGLDVDIRTDVYSLGVLLYKLLVGRMPFEEDKAAPLGAGQILQMIREQEPSQPSARLSSLGKDSVLAARKRGTDQATLVKRLRGDLDWITMKALEKDRTRRYPSVSELSNDILRHLRNEPVLAGPPSAMYVLGKYVRRHKPTVVFAIILVVLLAAFAVTMAFQANRIARERDRANQEAATALEISSFLEGIFEVSDPSEAMGSSITARQVLDQGAEKIDRELAGQPLVQARLLESMGRVYRSLGLYQAAGSLLEQALGIRRSLQKSGHADVARSLNELAQLYFMMEDYAAARPLYEEALAIGERAPGPRNLDVARSLHGLANLHYEAGEYDGALPLFERAERIREQELGPDHTEVAEILAGLASLHFKKGNYGAARPLYERALKIRELRLPPDHPELAESLHSLGNLLRKTGDLREAQPLYERALKIRERILAPDHPHVADSLYALANLHYTNEDYEEAQPLYDRALEIRQKIFAPDSPVLAETMNSLAALLHHHAGNYEAALPLYERVLEIEERARGRGHIDTAAPLRNLGFLWVKLEDLAAARAYHERALEIRQNILGSDHADVAESLADIAKLYNRAGDLNRAREYCERALEIRHKVLSPDDPLIADSLDLLATLYYFEGDYNLARQYLERVVAIRDKAGDALAGRGYYNLACVSALEGDRAAAVDFLRKAVDRGYAEAGILNDSDLDTLRDLPEFEAILAEIKRRNRQD